MSVYKSELLDKIDAHLLKEPHFVHNEYYVSRNSEAFHMSDTYLYKSGRRGTAFGINKKLWKASGEGYLVDGAYQGKGPTR